MMWSSPHIGGAHLTWDNLMEMDVWERNIIATRIDELREAESDAIEKAAARK